MATYTGVADANGNFTISFSTPYTSGQKVTVTAEKDGAEKTIELYAPSPSTNPKGMFFSGSMSNFPIDIGDIFITGISGAIALHSAFAAVSANLFFAYATGLKIDEGLTSVTDYCFNGWIRAAKLELPATLQTMGERSFGGFVACTEIICKRITPPTIRSDTFSGLNESCVIRVPSESLSAYQNAANWSAFSSRMVGY
ncbi:leucine-rich repeat protein [Acinetobacter bereziniae]|uniref:leucine-rich repeat protein n=1 Tax=Acinetobacter bereziniae TaxID=106648 RepID=UPI00125EFFED|nr:leucine-rich repeat protein [Acinetobacter bereziniae]